MIVVATKEAAAEAIEVARASLSRSRELLTAIDFIHGHNHAGVPLAIHTLRDIADDLLRDALQNLLPVNDYFRSNRSREK
jgi:hypothetical protein